ncbi:MAG: hypothetical protein KC443_06620 [Anaerolineales bacterium]|nr:hypothetical protein [Anaerolineales bacterium]MCB8966044.1 hypothetical protein [Ardenticatenaceae bacterium]
MEQNYQAYMLRVWKERTEHTEITTPIRLSLENTKTGTRIGFTDLDRLIQYLHEQMSIGNGGISFT